MPRWLGLLLDRETTERHEPPAARRLRYARLRQPGRRRGCRLPRRPRPRPHPVPEARRLPLDRRAPEPDHRRADRGREKLAGLRARPQGLPRQPLGPLPAHAASCSPTSPWRAATAATAAHAQRSARQAADPRRLGPGAARPEQRRDLLEIVEERYGRGATLITSQIPVDRWHDLIGDPTLADAILDRIIHNAHRIELKGDSLRKRNALPHDARPRGSHSHPRARRSVAREGTRGARGAPPWTPGTIRSPLDQTAKPATLVTAAASRPCRPASPESAAAFDRTRWPAQPDGRLHRNAQAPPCRRQAGCGASAWSPYSSLAPARPRRRTCCATRACQAARARWTRSAVLAKALRIWPIPRAISGFGWSLPNASMPSKRVRRVCAIGGGIASPLP